MVKRKRMTIMSSLKILFAGKNYFDAAYTYLILLSRPALICIPVDFLNIHATVRVII